MRSLKHAPRASSCGEVPSRSQDRSFDGGMSVAKERVYGLCLPKHWALRHHLVAKPHGADHERPAARQEDTGGDAKAQVGKHQGYIPVAPRNAECQPRSAQHKRGDCQQAQSGDREKGREIERRAASPKGSTGNERRRAPEEQAIIAIFPFDDVGQGQERDIPPARREKEGRSQSSRSHLCKEEVGQASYW